MVPERGAGGCGERGRHEEAQTGSHRTATEMPTTARGTQEQRDNHVRGQVGREAAGGPLCKVHGFLTTWLYM